MTFEFHARRPSELRHAAAAALAAVLFLPAAACAEGAPAPGPVAREGLLGSVWDVAEARPIAPAELAERLGAADIAILGEVHDNPTHHARQAWLVRRIAPEGLAFEMIPEASEEGIAVFRETGATPAEIGPAIGWNRLGWPDWALYRPILEAAPDAYLAGAGVERDAIGRAIREDARAAYGAGAAEAGLDRDLPPGQQAEAEAEMVASHCDMLPEAQAAPMVEAQRLRDARFARAALRAAERGGGNAVLITGNGHARTDRGVPVYLARLAPGMEVLSLGQVELRAPDASFEDHAGQGLPYDFVWFSETVRDRPDPCAAFGRE